MTIRPSGKRAIASGPLFLGQCGRGSAARDSIAGVNLDEEAANMLRLQQAYQAAAQVISTADTMFQSILNAVR